MRAATRQGRYGLGLVAAVSVLGAAVLALVAAPRVGMKLVQAPSQTVERLSLPMAPSGVLQILNAGGHIAVSAWDGDRALLTITREAVRGGNLLTRWFGGDEPGATISPRVRENDTGVEVSTVHGADELAHYRIDVKLPRGRGLAASNGNGPITVAGIDGDVRAVSENGDVRCEAVSGRVDARVQNGNVFCRYVSGAIDVNAANGSVAIEHGNAVAAYPVRVWTTNGPIRFSATAPSVNLLAETENGRVVSEVAPGEGVHRTLRTLDSRGDSPQAEVELHAINGNIYVDAF
jgi:hypothetical protein